MIIKGKLEDLLTKFNARLERVEKKLDLIDSDRIIFENIQGRLTQLEEEWRMTREHDREVKKDIKEEINIVGDRTTASVETGIQEVRDIIKSGKTSKPRKGLAEKIIDKIKRR